MVSSNSLVANHSSNLPIVAHTQVSPCMNSLSVNQSLLSVFRVSCTQYTSGSSPRWTIKCYTIKFPSRNFLTWAIVCKNKNNSEFMSCTLQQVVGCCLLTYYGDTQYTLLYVIGILEQTAVNKFTSFHVFACVKKMRYGNLIVHGLKRTPFGPPRTGTNQGLSNTLKRTDQRSITC